MTWKRPVVRVHYHPPFSPRASGSVPNTIHVFVTYHSPFSLRVSGSVELRFAHFSLSPTIHISKIQKSPSYHAKSLVSFNASSPRHPSVYSRFTDRFYHRSACRSCWHLVLEKDISLWSTFWSRLWSWCGDD